MCSGPFGHKGGRSERANKGAGGGGNLVRANAAHPHGYNGGRERGSEGARERVSERSKEVEVSWSAQMR
jgi:hypothetical protein